MRTSTRQQSKRAPTASTMLVAAVSMVAPAASFGGASFFDYARVLEVDPITETVTVPVRKEHCEPSPGALQADEAFAGDVRSVSLNHSIGAAIRDEIRHREHTAGLRRCRLVTVYDTQVRIIGYRVRYTYGGDDFVRRMDNPPGERIPVKVTLDPS